MRTGIQVGLAVAKISTAILPAVVAIALMVPRDDVISPRSAKVAEQSPPVFTAIDLAPGGWYSDSHAVGISWEQQVGDAYLRGTTHALLWRGSAASMVDLHPGGFEESEAHGICGDQQVGEGSARGPQKVHALLWRGRAGSLVDLTPSGFGAVALGTSGDEQVGYGNPMGANNSHALLWRGSAASVVDLHPRRFTWSIARGVSGEQQVGIGSLPSTTGYRNEHALLWRGSAASVVDLHPSGFDFTDAWGVSGGQQVGTGHIVDRGGSRIWGDHALLWRGSAASVVDLTPGGSNAPPDSLASAVAFATNGEEQVGRAGGRAVLWRGSATSVVDLQVFLPPGVASSQAMAIDANGNVVGYASHPPAPDAHAFLWRRNVPKPAGYQGQNMPRCK